MLVKDLMTKNVVAVKPSMDVHQLAELFMKKDISGAPVVDEEGKFLGVVLEESLVFQNKNVHLPTFVNLAGAILSFGAHRFEEELKKITGSKVSDIMETKALTLSPETPIEDVATMMIEKNIHYFPVLEKGALVGVITKKDIVRGIAEGKLL